MRFSNLSLATQLLQVILMQQLGNGITQVQIKEKKK
jgi:hypothetical protein